MIDKAIAIDNNYYFYFIKGLLYFNKQLYKKSIIEFDKGINLKDDEAIL